MNKEIQSIIKDLNETLQGEPWYGKPVFMILAEVDHAKAFNKPGGFSHSQIELLFHMVNWAEFTLHKIKSLNSDNPGPFEETDWTKIDPSLHSWADGLSRFKNIHFQLLELLHDLEDDFLEENVSGKKYNYRFLINGLIQHNIYHAGQVAYATKLV